MTKGREIAQIVQALIDEAFPLRHLQAIARTVGLFNDSEQAEAEVFAFAAKLYRDYAGGKMPRLDLEGNQHGQDFLRECREIIAECSEFRNNPRRAARVAIFALCVMLDGSGESLGPRYELSVRTEDGALEPVIFKHSDL